MPALPLMDAASVLAKASSEVWSTRAGGCAELAVLMVRVRVRVRVKVRVRVRLVSPNPNSNPNPNPNPNQVLMGSHRGAELLPMLDRVSAVLLERLADPHYKVAPYPYP